MHFVIGVRHVFFTKTLFVGVCRALFFLTHLQPQDVEHRTARPEMAHEHRARVQTDEGLHLGRQRAEALLDGHGAVAGVEGVDAAGHNRVEGGKHDAAGGGDDGPAVLLDEGDHAVHGGAQAVLGAAVFAVRIRGRVVDAHEVGDEHRDFPGLQPGLGRVQGVSLACVEGVLQRFGGWGRKGWLRLHGGRAPGAQGACPWETLHGHQSFAAGGRVETKTVVRHWRLRVQHPREGHQVQLICNAQYGLGGTSTMGSTCRKFRDKWSAI